MRLLRTLALVVAAQLQVYAWAAAIFLVIAGLNGNL